MIFMLLFNKHWVERSATVYSFPIVLVQHLTYVERVRLEKTRYSLHVNDLQIFSYKKKSSNKCLTNEIGYTFGSGFP